MVSVERVGQYDIKQLSNGKYSVSLNNGNTGAFVTDEKGLQEFLAKQGDINFERSPQTDEVNFTGNNVATNPNQENKGSNTTLKLLGTAAVVAGGYLFFKNTKVGRKALDWIKGLFKKTPVKKVAEATTKAEKEAKIINNIETSTANSSSRKLVEQAIKDTPTPAQQAAYDAAIAYQKPTKEQAKIIAKVNEEAARETTRAHQVQNLVPEKQAQALKEVKTTVENVKNLNGTFLSNGNIVELNNGNIVKIVTQDGREITKLKTIAKYEAEGKVDLKNLTNFAEEQKLRA